MSFPFYRQHDQMDCGPACLRMIAKHHGRSFSLRSLREWSHIDREGVSVQGIAVAAERIGMRSLAVQLPFAPPSGAVAGDPGSASLQMVPLPCIAHWKQHHFVVVYRVSPTHVWVADPAGTGPAKMTREAFEKGWLSNRVRGDDTGVLLLLEASPDFHVQDGEKITRRGLGFLLRYLRPYRRMITQLLLGLVVASGLQLLFPFLTQAIVDVGIENQDIGFVWLILLAQLTLFFSQTTVQFVRSWILLHLGSRINLALLSDFLIKLMRLPQKFFDTKTSGDILQRVSDHYRIEQFLTASTLGTLFSAVSLMIFGGVLLYYNATICLIFFVGAVLYLGWIALFLKKRRNIDQQRFAQHAENQNKLMQMIQGMSEIKLQNSEQRRRWEWERVQIRLMRTNVRALALEQWQEGGAVFVNECKNIIITVVAAQAVIEGQMTLGMMLAVQYLIGQMNGPLNQTLYFVRAAQDARFSLERLGELHDEPDEESAEEHKLQTLPEQRDIRLEQVRFQYSPISEPVLRDISLTIPGGKVTAIVGASGSGKTTLVKLLLKFYEPVSGGISVGNTPLRSISARYWRDRCGAVLQEGFLFSESIAENIAANDEHIDQARLLQSVKVANIQSFVESLPLSFNTKIGPEGVGLSQGQRQRLLIARAVYKNPDFLFFDEATNALDARNERAIVENLRDFYQGRTVVIVAHRLSTVRDADLIVVLDQGRIAEQGTHEELTALRGFYYGLVKNQLELGS